MESITPQTRAESWKALTLPSGCKGKQKKQGNESAAGPASSSFSYWL